MSAIVKSKPLIRWAGSKRKLLPTLLNNIPDSFNRYVEPFCGSACLFFELAPNKALLSDINVELINALENIRSGNNLYEELVSIRNSNDEYYRIRSIEPETLSSRERAIRFLYLNRYCFNGVYRTNKSGKFNVPRGTRTGLFPEASVFDEAKLKLSNATLAVSSYEKVLDSLKKGDFVYIDPPYAKSGRFTGEYGLGSFDSNSFPELSRKLTSLDRLGVKFLLSYAACEEILKPITNNFSVIDLSVKRHISGFKKIWSEAREVLIRNF